VDLKIPDAACKQLVSGCLWSRSAPLIIVLLKPDSCRLGACSRSSQQLNVRSLGRGDRKIMGVSASWSKWVSSSACKGRAFPVGSMGGHRPHDTCRSFFPTRYDCILGHDCVERHVVVELEDYHRVLQESVLCLQ
jgi:hypothetical protein